MNLFYLNFISIRTLRTFISIRTIRTLRTFFSIRTIRTLRTFFSIRTIRTIRTFISIRTIRTFSPADFKRFKKNSSLLTHHYSYSPARCASRDLVDLVDFAACAGGTSRLIFILLPSAKSCKSGKLFRCAATGYS